MILVLKILLTVTFAARTVHECIWALSQDPKWFQVIAVKKIERNDGSGTSRLASLIMAATWVAALWMLWR